MLLTIDRIPFQSANTPVVLSYEAEAPAIRECKNSLTITADPENRASSPLRLCLFALTRPQKNVKLEFSPLRGGQSGFSLGKVLRDLRGLLRECLAPLDPDTRHRILNWLATATSEHKPGPCAKLGQSLELASRGLRNRLAPAVINADTHRGIYVDSLFGLDDRAFYIRGWASVASGTFKTLTAVSPEGFRVSLEEKAFWHERADVNQLYSVPSERAKQFKAGFLCYLELPSPSLSAQGWVVEGIDAEGEGIETTGPKVCTDINKARSTLISDIAHEKLPNQFLRVNHVLPAITRVQEQHHRTADLDWVRSYGNTPDNPTVSILIPLYRRTDFLEHQMAQFAGDPQMRSAEIIYLLDSPELAESLHESAGPLYELYKIPFKLAALRSHSGYAAVNNLGAGVARGRLLLLLNSDVLPKSPGWLGQMIQFFDSKPTIGALGIKLLFEDETLQHAGLYFRRSPVSGLWENQHYFKGFDSGLPGANVTRTVPALCAACLMIERDRYLRMSGLRGLYIQGDYEDSDLCLRLQDDGREIWYLPEVELYHLEGQSYASQDRARNTIWNRWLHTHLWDKKIEALMNDKKSA
jgi:GT2 family glycosyltransferase